MNQQHEELLVKRAQRGDRQALGELWDSLTPKLFGYLVNTTHDKILAEDLLQATWLKAIEALPKYQARGFSISAWLFAIARNECRQHWRKTRKEAPFDESYDRANENNNDEEKIFVEQILNLLSEEDREIIRLRYIAGLSPNDIAKILNINFVAARVRLHRALARARVLIKS